jgi:hypothetical protein
MANLYPLEREARDPRAKQRAEIKKEIIIRNQLRGPLSYDANNLLDMIADQNMENANYERKYRPSFSAWGDYD